MLNLVYQPNKKEEVITMYKMDNTENNVINVQNEDKNFIHSLMSLSVEKKLLIQGIIIGLDLQDNKKKNAQPYQLSFDDIISTNGK